MRERMFGDSLTIDVKAKPRSRRQITHAVFHIDWPVEDGRAFVHRRQPKNELCTEGMIGHCHAQVRGGDGLEGQAFPELEVHDGALRGRDLAEGRVQLEGERAIVAEPDAVEATEPMLGQPPLGWLRALRPCWGRSLPSPT